MRSLAIVGFGLVGASIAAAVRASEPTVEITAIDLSTVLTTPAARDLADALIDSADRTRVLAAAANADLCVLSAPVAIIATELPELLEVAQVITDCGSTKRSICASVASSARRGRFVPGHPMAGGPEGGAGLARADLFRGQTWLLCPEQSDADAVLRVEELLFLAGAVSVKMSVEAHDRAVAYTSHALQLVASALATLAAHAGAAPTAGPAYRATTRSAGGAEVMWRDIFGANADEVSVVLRQLNTELAAVAEGLEASPRNLGPALDLLARARAARRR